MMQVFKASIQRVQVWGLLICIAYYVIQSIRSRGRILLLLLLLLLYIYIKHSSKNAPILAHSS